MASIALGRADKGRLRERTSINSSNSSDLSSEAFCIYVFQRAILCITRATFFSLSLFLLVRPADKRSAQVVANFPADDFSRRLISSLIRPQKKKTRFLRSFFSFQRTTSTDDAAFLLSFATFLSVLFFFFLYPTDIQSRYPRAI